MGMLTKFVSSKFSGYALIGILVALAAGGYWFWSEIKEFGSLTEKAEQQAREIKSLESEALYQQARADERAEIGSRLAETVAGIESKYRNLSVQFAEELRNAPKEYIDCRNMPVPDGLRYPDAESGVQDD